jgi:hypothetical protein
MEEGLLIYATACGGPGAEPDSGMANTSDP